MGQGGREAGEDRFTPAENRAMGQETNETKHKISGREERFMTEWEESRQGDRVVGNYKKR